MKVILLKDVKAHGKEGDVVEVSEGYARNFLFPQNSAVQASPGALTAMQTKKKQASAKEKRELGKMHTLASALDGFPLTVVCKANEHGKLFAALSEKEVVKALKKEGHEVDAKWIHFSAPIKEVGERLVRIELPHGLEAELHVTVEAF